MREKFRRFRQSEAYETLIEILGSTIAIILGFGLAFLILLIGVAEGWQM